MPVLSSLTWFFSRQNVFRPASDSVGVFIFFFSGRSEYNVTIYVGERRKYLFTDENEKDEMSEPSTIAFSNKKQKPEKLQKSIKLKSKKPSMWRLHYI